LIKINTREWDLSEGRCSCTAPASCKRCAQIDWRFFWHVISSQHCSWDLRSAQSARRQQSSRDILSAFRAGIIRGGAVVPTTRFRPAGSRHQGWLPIALQIPGIAEAPGPRPARRRGELSSRCWYRRRRIRSRRCRRLRIPPGYDQTRRA